MTEAALEALGDGRFALRGPVVFATAGELLAEGNRLFAGSPQVRIEMAAVTRVDSAALALLIEWLRQAKASGQSLSFQAMPEKLRAIAKLTGAGDILEPGGSSGAAGAA